MRARKYRSLGAKSTSNTGSTLITELCVLPTFGGVDFSLDFICVQAVSEFLWDRLRATIQFRVMTNVRNTHGSVGNFVKLRVSYYQYTLYILLNTWSKRSGTPTFDVPLGPKLRYSIPEAPDQ
eukprot:COSAG02_NODE_1769_length_10996_cov_22.332385_4_plen_123_part_00